MTTDEIITLDPDDEDVLANFATLRERATGVSEHFADDELFVRMLTYAGYRELIELVDDYSDDDDDEYIRGFQ